MGVSIRIDQHNADKSFQDGIVAFDATPGNLIEWFAEGSKARCGTGWPHSVKVQAKKGDRIRIYGGLGDTIRGIDINGQIAFYRTTSERDKRHRDYLRANDREEEKEYKRNSHKLEENLAKLPQPFKDRIERFRSSKKDWDKKYLAYEMVCLVDAMNIVEAAQTLGKKNPIAWIDSFKDKSYKQHLKLVPNLDPGHSGNTFGMAVHMAKLYLEGNDTAIVWEHGAMVPLVGCIEYGCFHDPEMQTISIISHQVDSLSDDLGPS